MDACVVALSQPHIVRSIIEATLDTCYTIDERQKTRFFCLAVLSKRWARECQKLDRSSLALHFNADPGAHVPLAQLPEAQDLELIVSLKGLHNVGRTVGPMVHQSRRWLMRLFPDVEKRPELKSLRISIQQTADGLYPADLLRTCLFSYWGILRSLTTLRLETWIGPGSSRSDRLDDTMLILSHLSPTLQHLGLAISGRMAETERSPRFALKSLTCLGGSKTATWAISAADSLAWAGQTYRFDLHDQPDLSNVAHLIVQDICPAYCDQDHPTFPAVETLGFVHWIGNGNADFEEPSVEPFFRHFPALSTLRIGPIDSSVIVDKVIAAVAQMPESLQLDVVRGRGWSDEQVDRMEQACEQRHIGLRWFAAGTDWVGGLSKAEKAARFEKAIMQPMRCEEEVRQVWLDIFQRG